MRQEPHRLVFIDETATTTKMTRRAAGRAGASAFAPRRPSAIGGRRPSSPALRCGALTAPWIIDAPMNRTIFETYVETQLAPTLRQATSSSSTICPPTKARSPRAIRERGAWFLFLPPYSPDLNPIEMAFAKLKAHLRAQGQNHRRSSGSAIGNICDLFTPDECWNFLKPQDMHQIKRMML